MNAERHEVVTSDARIGVTVRGAGPTVLVIPSMGRSVADFADLADRLVVAGHRVVMPEPRGIGASRGSNENITLAVLAGDAAAVIDRLCQSQVIERPTLGPDDVTAQLRVGLTR